MAWQGETLAEICAQIKDRDGNGGRERAPGSWAAFARLIEEWDASGAECPTR
jgi:hypothetical protein